MQNPPESEIEPMSSAVAGGVFTTEPPGKLQHSWLGEVIAAVVAC